jgi:hypothetical protein
MVMDGGESRGSGANTAVLARVYLQGCHSQMLIYPVWIGDGLQYTTVLGPPMYVSICQECLRGTWTYFHALYMTDMSPGSLQLDDLEFVRFQASSQPTPDTTSKVQRHLIRKSVAVMTKSSQSPRGRQRTREL